MKIIKAILLCFTIGVIGAINSSIQTVNAKGLSSIVVIEKTSGRILYSENENEIMPMASTTKIATAITFIDNFNASKIIEVPKDFKGVEGSSVYLKSGEKYSAEDLLYGLMLRSGNDCAEVLASAFCKREEFILLMNKTAKKCNAMNTNFINPHGLHEGNHYTTAIDLSNITKYALGNELFRKIVSTKKHVAIELNSNEKRIWTNKNKMLTNFEGATGVKTGYTIKAGRCLVSSAKRNDMELICVALNVYDMFERSSTILNGCFNEYKMVKILAKERFSFKIPDKELNYHSVFIERDFIYPLSQSDELQIDVQLPKFINKPIKNKEKVGEIRIYTLKQLIFSQNIYTLI